MKIFVFVILLGFVLSNSLSFGQVKGFSPIDTDRFLQDEFSSRFNDGSQLQTENIPLGDIIVPEFYYVGPGDILTVQNLTTSISNQYIVVSPESTVLLPRIGEVDLKGKTLAEARIAIIEAIKGKNKKALAYVTLFKPRMVIITLKGDVTIQGSFTVPASYRVSTALKMIDRLNKDQIPFSLSNSLSDKYISDDYKRKVMSEASSIELVKYSSRNILIIHNDGSSQIADFEDAAVTGNIEMDPFVRENDIITIPSEPYEFPEISISGAVLRPVRLPYKSNDNIGKLLKFGYGIREDADLDNIFLSTADGRKEKLNLNSDLSFDNPDRPIEPGSSIIIGEQKRKTTKTGIVYIQGFVNKPGSYVLNDNLTNLYDLIAEAGGFMNEAYLPLAYILRNDRSFLNRTFPLWDISENFQYSDLKLEDTVRFKLDVNYKKPIVSCDFVKAFIDSNEQYNIPLLDGDLIIVPDNPRTVYVYGQVNEPGYIEFEPERTINWYIEKAGGYAINAEKSRARIINGRNKVWYEGSDEVFVYAGDEIYVPKPPDYPPGLELQTYAVIASAVTSLVALLNIILILTN